MLQNVLVEKAKSDGEDGATSSHNAVDNAHSLLEVVAEDGEGRSVDETCAGTKHDAVGEVEHLHLLVTNGSREAHPQGGQHGAQESCRAQTYFVRQDADQEGEEEGGADGE